MGYLRTDLLEVEGNAFEIRELSYADYQHVIGGTEAEQAIRAVCRGVEGFRDRPEEEVAAELPARYVSKLASAIMRLSVPEDAVGNFDGAQEDGSSSD